MKRFRQQRLGPLQSRSIGLCLRVVATAGSFALLAALYFGSGPSTAHGWWSVFQTFGFVAVLACMVSLLSWLIHQSDRHLTPAGRQALQNDKRPPVLYLRPFVSETVLTVQEQLLARIMQAEVGPLVAVGDPGDRLPQLGAARFYQRDFTGDGQSWQVFVRNMLLRCRLVLMVPGSSVGLAFEIAQCREVLAPEQLVVLVQGDEAAYTAFRAHAQQAGLVLPEIPAHDVGWAASSDIIAIITFGRSWEAKYCPLKNRTKFGDATIEELERRLRQALVSPLAALGIAIRQS